MVGTLGIGRVGSQPPHVLTFWTDVSLDCPSTQGSVLSVGNTQQLSHSPHPGVFWERQPLMTWASRPASMC